MEVGRIFIWLVQGVKLTNQTAGGEGPSGLVHTAETRSKLRAARKRQSPPHKGRTHSPETRAKMRNMSQETRAKISAQFSSKIRGMIHKYLPSFTTPQQGASP